MSKAVIVEAVRTPSGRRNGKLKDIHPTKLAAAVLNVVVRRAGDYAITRPARELLFTALPKESRFKAKNVIDTVIYRGGDAANAWLYALLASAGLGLSGTAATGVVIAAVWAGVAWRLGRQFSRVVEPQGRSIFQRRHLAGRFVVDLLAFHHAATRRGQGNHQKLRAIKA